MFLNKFKAFTLAELMIVFTVIGIITAIIIPILFMASPDQPEVKARKAYNSFVRTMESLTNGAPYDVNDGLLDATALVTRGEDRVSVEDVQDTFFCNNIASFMNVKEFNCNNVPVGSQMNKPGVVAEYASSAPKDRCYPNCPQNLKFDEATNTYLYDNLKNSLDHICVDHVAVKFHNDREGNRDKVYNFITSDNVGWTIQKYRFNHGNVLTDREGNVIDGLKGTHTYGGVTTHTLYAAVCINTSNNLFPDLSDLDKYNAFRSHNNVYAIGVNREGKILPGKKLQDLIEKTVEK